MAKDKKQADTLTPEQKALIKARAKQARRLEGGQPSLRGIIIKIILLAIVDAGAMFAAMLLLAKHQWLYFGVELVITLVVNWLYLRRGHLPAKYLAPGVVLLVLFQISVVFFSGFIAFTNYGALHRKQAGRDGLNQAVLDCQRHKCSVHVCERRHREQEWKYRVPCH